MPSQTGTRGDLVAAVDLGSNSFHMVIARQTGHDLQILDRIRASRSASRPVSTVTAA